LNRRSRFVNFRSCSFSTKSDLDCSDFVKRIIIMDWSERGKTSIERKSRKIAAALSA